MKYCPYGSFIQGFGIALYIRQFPLLGIDQVAAHGRNLGWPLAAVPKKSCFTASRLSFGQLYGLTPLGPPTPIPPEIAILGLHG
jgi:hypothetical protein